MDFPIFVIVEESNETACEWWLKSAEQGDKAVPSKSSKILTNLKEKHHPRSFQNPLNAQTATDHTIHQSTNLDHAMDVIESTTAEENVKRNIGRQKERNPHKENCNKKTK